MLEKLLQLFRKESKENSEINDKDNSTNETKELSFNDAKNVVQGFIINEKLINSSDGSLAMAGNLEKIGYVKDQIKSIIINKKIKVAGLNTEELGQLIYAKIYGLDIVQKYYEDKDIDEIQYNGDGKIFVIRKGVQECVPERLDDPDEVENLIKRKIIEDVGISLDMSNPIVESIRHDGARLTATCYSVTKSWTFNIRKHDSFEPSLENYINSETLNEYVWNILSLLVRANTRILFSGNVGSGKTTIMKKVIGEINDLFRIVVIGKDLELRLQEYYQNKNILELEEQEQLGIMMKGLLYTALRESPDILVIEEFRGAGEAIEAVRACTRGIPALATAHFTTPEISVEGTAMFMLEEGLNLPLELAKLRVARAFNIVVQMKGDRKTGKKKVISITEIGVSEDNEIFYNELIKWNPSCEDYFGKGTWEKVNNPSPGLLNEMNISVSIDEIASVGWDTSCLTCSI